MTEKQNNTGSVAAEMAEVYRTGTSERFERERQQAQKAAQQEQIAAQAEEDRRAANVMLDVQEQRNKAYRYSNLGTLSDGELRRLVRNDHGFEPI